MEENKEKDGKIIIVKQGKMEERGIEEGRIEKENDRRKEDK